MAQSTEWLESINELLDILPQKTVTRGRGYFRNGHVLKLNCIQPERHYRAVVQGGEDYRVDLQFNEDWNLSCTCPMGTGLQTRRRGAAQTPGAGGKITGLPLVEKNLPVSQFSRPKQNPPPPPRSAAAEISPPG